ncbi:MAG: 3'(2'),5'-bisphosphate nucleotidase CysQ [Alphaproteobacteria bacterium]|nr:3'(2'),5'-bisphosphate nucleotidase CysQ [Alphaproteobacteria bacterium]
MLADLVAAVDEAGALALRYFRNGVKSWDKHPGDPVSEADLAVDGLLRERLAALDPAAGWMSEESARAPDLRAAKRVWIVDPIDGTRAFLKGQAEFSVVAALVEDGRPLLAAVCNPATKQMFAAARGQGTTLNAIPVSVTRVDDPVGGRLLMGEKGAKRLGLEGKAEIRMVSSIAYRLCLVAAGRYDACVSLGEKSDWDIAAADLIVSEAGGLATAVDGSPFVYNLEPLRHPSVLAAGPKLHARLMADIKALPKA